MESKIQQLKVRGGVQCEGEFNAKKSAVQGDSKESM
jgi:hypothetical protein